jgi:hypothetical protein
MWSLPLERTRTTTIISWKLSPLGFIVADKDACENAFRRTARSGLVTVFAIFRYVRVSQWWIRSASPRVCAGSPETGGEVEMEAKRLIRTSQTGLAPVPLHNRKPQ